MVHKSEEKESVITIQSPVMEADSIKDDLTNVYDYINMLIGMLPDDAELNARELREVQFVLEYLVTQCDYRQKRER